MMPCEGKTRRETRIEMRWEVRANRMLAQGVKEKGEGMMVRGVKLKIGLAKRDETRRMSLDVKGW